MTQSEYDAYVKALNESIVAAAWRGGPSCMILSSGAACLP